MKERWKDIPEYEGYYQASTLGRIRRLANLISHNQGGSRVWPGRILKLGSRNGYSTVTLCKDGKTKEFQVHRLILLTFVGPCPDGMETRHKNNIRSDNRRSNLRWGTPLQNHADKIKSGTTSKGSANPRAKINEDIAFIIKTMKGKMTAIRLSSVFDLDESYIYAIQAGKHWSHVKV